MSIRVVNARAHRAIAGSLSVYIGRPGSFERAQGLCGRELLDYSVLGNPFMMGGEGRRAKVIDEYRRWLWGKMKDPDSKQLWAIKHLASISMGHDGRYPVNLVCWCAPLPCHGDVIKAAIEWLLSQPLEVG